MPKRKAPTGERRTIKTGRLRLGCDGLGVTRRLIKERYLKCFIRSQGGKSLTADGLNIFRCLAVGWRGASEKRCECEARALRNAYCESQGINLNEWEGPTVREIRNIEKTFQVGIAVWVQAKNFTVNARKFWNENLNFGSCIDVYVTVRRSCAHACLITNVKAFCEPVSCEKCSKVFHNRRNYLRDHLPRCRGGKRKTFKSGVFRLPLKLHEQLIRMGLKIDDVSDIFQRYFVSFDIESCLEKAEMNNFDTEKTKHPEKHGPLAVFVATNIPDEETQYFLNSDGTNSYLKQFLDHLEMLAAKAKELNVARLKYIFDELEEIQSNATTLNRHQFARQVERRANQLTGYCGKLPIFGYNSRSYDLLVLRKTLLPLLEKDHGGIKFIRNRTGNQYDAIVTESFRCVSLDSFLDVLCFLGVSCPLQQFVTSFGGALSKTWFPYSLLHLGLNGLRKQGLPKIGDFKSHYDVENTLGSTPEEIQTNYRNFCQLYKENKCKSLMDWLILYGKRDVECMIKPIENLAKMFWNFEVDLFANHITLQSAIVPIMMSGKFNRDGTVWVERPGDSPSKRHKVEAPQNHYFVTPDPETYNLLRQKGITGGLAAVYTRRQVRNETPIRLGSRIRTKIIRALDSNSQYLGAVGDVLPAGPYAVRRADTNFLLQVCCKARRAIQWLDYMANHHGRRIFHMLNGREGTVWAGGRCYRPDGIMYPIKTTESPDAPTTSQAQSKEPKKTVSRAKPTLLFYDGCVVHGCKQCGFVGDTLSPLCKRPYTELINETSQRNKDLTAAGYKLIIEKECVFNYMAKHDKNVKEKLQSLPGGPNHGLPLPMEQTQDSMKCHLISGKIFGFAEVDLDVRQDVRDDPQQMRRLEAFPPIIRHFWISQEMLPPELQKIASEQNRLPKPLKNLVGCLTAKKMLVYTPYLQYLVKLGIEITFVHTVIQFKAGQKPFEGFAKFVAQQRREGDREKSSVKSETFKRIGSSAYGMFAFNPEKSKSILKVCGKDAQKKWVKHPRFISRTPLDDGFAEIEMEAGNIKYEWPIQVAAAVYGLAKLNLVQFAHSYILKYFKFDRINICACDTDSLFVAFAADDPETHVYPELKTEYEATKHNFIVNTTTPEDAAYTKRTPLLFKTEAEGTYFCALSAKTYLLLSNNEVKKVAAKGVNVKRNFHLFRPEIFDECLETFVPATATNMGLRVPHSGSSDVHTILQNKVGLQPFYIKRFLLAPNYVFSRPLDETLEAI